MSLAVALQATENRIATVSRERRLNSAVATRRDDLTLIPWPEGPRL